MSTRLELSTRISSGPVMPSSGKLTSWSWSRPLVRSVSSLASHSHFSVHCRLVRWSATAFHWIGLVWAKAWPLAVRAATAISAAPAAVRKACDSLMGVLLALFCSGIDLDVDVAHPLDE